MKKSRLFILMAALMVVSALVLAACGSSDDDSSSDSGSSDSAFASELITEGTLTVGSDIPYPPFEFGEAPGYDGFDIALVDAIAKDIGVTPKYVDTSFETIFPDVAQGKFDMVASAVTIDKERAKIVDFSQPYFETEQALVVPEGSDIATVEDLAGKTVGAQDGTTGETYANEDTDASEVRGFPSGPAAIQAVNAGQVDATIVDIEVAKDAIKKGEGGFEVATNIATGEQYGLAFAKNTPELLTAVDDTLTKFKEDGTLNEIYQEWFKKDAPKSIIDTTSPTE